VIISAKTDVGAFRENNQDAFLTGTFVNGDAWAIVCDGMGGVSGGQIASALCVEKAASVIKKGYRNRMSVKSVKNLLESAISAANAVVFEESLKDNELKGMGTTIVAAVIIGSIAVIAYVGDSRAYIVNDTITQITKDHSLVQLMIDTGKITPEEAKNHPDKNIITRAVGVENFVDADIEIIDISPSDKLLLCTDGLSGAVENSDIQSIINEYREVSAEKLIEKALENGSRDNITAVVVDSVIEGE
jgi:protein phosphatase